VTVGQFKAFVTETGYQTEAEKSEEGALRRFPDGTWRLDPKANWNHPGFEQTDEHPAVCVSWNDAVAFCDWLSRKEGRTYALPTEAQWEYCCRSGFRARFGFPDDRKLDQFAWYATNAGHKTHPVGQLQGNAWGLEDMHGNALEWTADWYGADYYKTSSKEDPAGPPGGVDRVLRGGSWNQDMKSCRAASRQLHFVPSRCSGEIGFRVVLPR
jgi:formylglycine-generating enzyme required for sulfatase activity